MKRVDKFKWTAVGAAASILVATVVLAFVAPIYLITLWLGFAAGYISIRSLVLFVKEKELEGEEEIEEKEAEEKVSSTSASTPSLDVDSEMRFPKAIIAEPNIITEVEGDKELSKEEKEKPKNRKIKKKSVK